MSRPISDSLNEGEMKSVSSLFLHTVLCSISYLEFVIFFRIEVKSVTYHDVIYLLFVRVAIWNTSIWKLARFWLIPHDIWKADWVISKIACWVWFFWHVFEPFSVTGCFQATLDLFLYYFVICRVLQAGKWNYEKDQKRSKMTFLGLKMIIFAHFSRFLASFKISFSYKLS